MCKGFKILKSSYKYKYLNTIVINDSGLCDNCNVAVEANEHLFLDCQIALNHWVEIKWWISENL